MHEQNIKVQGYSPLFEEMEKFIQEKQAHGYKYARERLELLKLDRFLWKNGLQSPKLPREIVDQWTAKRDYEKSSNQRLRIIRIRQFALYLCRQGLDAYVPESTRATKCTEFIPYIFNQQQIKNILQAADNIPPDSRSPKRHLVMPEIFRLLYCCGMRVSELVRLKIADVNLDAGMLSIFKTKFNKDRLVPLAPTMTIRLRKYAATVLNATDASSAFFPKFDGTPYSKTTIYSYFRQLIWKCNIPHGGRGKGPRLHDLRHSFAVHRLESWYRQGADLGVKLPLLATYMGHKNLVSTQWYLRLTPEIFPDIVKQLEQFAGHVIPRRLEQ